MVEISFLTASDRARWEVPARGKDTYFQVERSGDDYERTWRRLLDDEQIRGIAARLDGKMAGIAHYLFHASVWYAGRCYLADLFVDAEVRRRGIATAVIEWVARDAKEHGFPGLYWNTLEDAPARALYDKVGKFHKGLIHYAYRRDANQISDPALRGDQGRAILTGPTTADGTTLSTARVDQRTGIQVGQAIGMLLCTAARYSSSTATPPPGSGTRSAARSHAINPATTGGHLAIMAAVEEVEVVVAHNERATLRVGDVFLKIDADQARIDVEVEAMAMAPVPTPEVLWRKPPVLALAAVGGTALGRLGEPSTASSAAWAAAGAAVRMLHDAPLPPWPRQSLDGYASELDVECEWLITNGVLPADMVTRNRQVAEAALRPYTPVFTHGDLQVDHVFIDGDEITGVIDWSEAGQGDPLFDLAILTLGHEEHLGGVVAGYGTDVDLDVIRAWWSLRSLLGVRWLVEHGFDPFAPGCEVDVLRSRL